jgi:DtxR family transcriptional regulator, Mn-dependent transcriptional regulator
MKTESSEDYLKSIYILQEEQNGEPVSTTRLAVHLGVASASVTGMLKRLSATEPPLVEYEPYYGVTLSPDGLKAALEIIRHHRLIETYLNQKLGYSWDEVHAEAERLEHVISEEMEERLASALNYPDVDPHGDPIPDRDGRVSHPAFQSLADIPEGQLVEVRRILGQEPELLRYLSDLGLTLSSKVQIVARAPFNGPVTILLSGQRKIILTVGREVVEKIQVLPLASSIGESE